MSYPNLGRLWDDEWPYRCSDGVGMELTGYPTDVEEFTWFLAQHSCHPKATARILERIAANGYDKLTVMAGLPFEAIAAGLAALGVQLKIIPPQPDWEQRYPSAEWTDELMNRIRQERRA